MKTIKPPFAEPARPPCAIYSRVSTEKQAEHNISIPDQITRCRVYAEMQGWEVVDVFVDPGASGRDETKRPEFREMIRRAKQPDRPYHFILVHSYSRFYRDQPKSELLRRELKKNRVQVRSLTQEINDDGGGGTFALSVMGLFDEYQSRETAKHVRRAMEANARDGFRNGGIPPHGYRLYVEEVRGQRPKKKLEIDPDEAQLVRDIFERHQRGLGVKSITTQLNEEGRRTRRGNKWGTGTIHAMLHNEAYVGREYFKGTDPDTGETKPREQWVLVPCPPIIDEGTFQRVQEQLGRRRPTNRAPRFTTSPVLLGGIAYCGSCGRHLQLCTGTARNGETHRYYKCAGKLLNGQCDGGEPISIPEDVLDGSVMDAVSAQMLTPERITKIVNELHQRRAQERDGVSDRVKHLRRQRSTAERQEKNLWELAASAGLEAVQGFKEKLAQLQEQKENIGRHIGLQEAILADSLKPIGPAEAEAVSKRMREMLGSADPEAKRRYVHSVIGRVDVTRTQIEITGQESTIAEAAMGSDIAADMPADRVRGSDLEWLPGPDSNRRPFD